MLGWRFLLLQSWPKKFVLGCVIPPAGAVARSRNLGQTFLANSVHLAVDFWTPWGARTCLSSCSYSGLRLRESLEPRDEDCGYGKATLT